MKPITLESINPIQPQSYCNEAAYRYNTRKIKDVERFVDALKKTKGRLRWADLVKRTPPKYTGIEFVSGE